MRKFFMAVLILAFLPFGQISANASTFAYALNTPLTELDPNGQRVNFTITQFPTKAGMYLQQCVAPAGNTRPVTCSDSNQLWITSTEGPGRTYSGGPILIKVVGSISNKGVTADCTKVQCGLFFRFDHTAPMDTSLDEFIKISFRSTNQSPQEGSPTVGKSNPVTVPVDTKTIPTPDLNDVYYPILKDLKFTIDLAAKIDANSRVIFPAVANVNLKVLYHRNPTHAVKIQFAQNLDAGVNEKNCSRFSTIFAPAKSFQTVAPDVSYGSSQIVLVEKIGNRSILEKLVKREKVGDWFEESFSFESPIYINEYLEPCLSSIRIQGVTIYDVAGKEKTLRVASGVNFVEIYDKNPILPENKCAKVFVGGWEQTFPIPCEDNGTYWTVPVLINPELIENSKIKAAADKAAADKAAADKAAADKAAADKAAADKAKVKEKTILCLKGKSSLKVIGKNPKCPAGFKVKK